MVPRWIAVPFVAVCVHVAQGQDNAEILWDVWGVPHVFADNLMVASYAAGRTQAHLHGNVLLRLYAESRGRASEYFGPGEGNINLFTDILTWSDEVPPIAEERYNLMDDEARGWNEAFAAGFNDYVDENPGEFDPIMLRASPIDGLDVWRHVDRVLTFIFTFGRAKTGLKRDQFLEGSRNRGAGPDYFKEKHLDDDQNVHYSAYVDYDVLGVTEKTDFGSNVWAINKPKSDGKGAKMIMNPHLDYTGFWRWSESQMTIESEDLNVYGAGLLGSTLPTIAFTDYLGWSHTNNIIQGWVNYRVPLVNSSHYVFDGEVLPIEEVRYNFEVLVGEGVYQTQTVVVEKTVHGSIFGRSGTEVLASRWSGLDRADAIRQRLNMLKARNLDEFRDAMRELEFGYFTTAGATRDGDIFYYWNGFVPKRNPDVGGDFLFWMEPVDGSTSATFFTDIHDFDELPQVENPPSGWVQNANEPPWTMTLPVVNESNYPAYFAPEAFVWSRPQVSMSLMVNNDNITFEQLAELKHSAFHFQAEHVVDELVNAVHASPVHLPPHVLQAASILERWDRALDTTSVGAVLFLELLRFLPSDAELFVNQWSRNDPLATPNTFVNVNVVINALERAVVSLFEQNIPIDVAYGDLFRVIDPSTPGGTLPGNGGTDTFRNTGYNGNGGVPSRGDTWVCVIEYGEDGSVRAKSLIGYGNASQGKHVDDQWDLYSRKELREVWRDREEILQHLERRETVTYSKAR